MSAVSSPQTSSTTPGVSKAIPLPGEIYESIIDELADDVTTLHFCALVCHLFSQRAQKHIFNRIYLTRPTKVYNAALRIQLHVWPSRRFLQIPSSSPHLAEYVKFLEISDEHRIKFYREELSWIRSDNAMHRILALLSNLETLSLKGSTQGSRLNFRMWRPDLRAAILERCSSERMVTINLVHVRNVPLSLLGLPPRLEELQLTRVLFVPDSELGRVPFGEAVAMQGNLIPKERYPPAQLKRLSLMPMTHEEWRTFYPWLDQVNLDHTHLKTLHLDINFDTAEDIVAEDFQAMSNLVRGCSLTVQTLTLYVPPEILVTTANASSELDLGPMPALRRLTLHSCIWDEFQSDIYTMVAGAHSTLSNAPSPRTTLRTMTSIISRTFLPKTHDGQCSTSNSGRPYHQLETLLLLLVIEDFKEMNISGLEDIGWEEFVQVVEELSAVKGTSVELERGTTESDSRLSATSVTIVVSISDEIGNYGRNLLEEKLGRLRSRGVGLEIE